MICRKIEDCTEKSKKPLDSWTDPKGGKSKFSIKNNNRIEYSKINFEECVYKGRENDTKCDYALIVGSTVYFIELKGSDVAKGYKQLEATITETKKCFPDFSLRAKLVVSKNNSPDLAKKNIAYKNLARLTNNDIEVKVNVISEKIS